MSTLGDLNASIRDLLVTAFQRSASENEQLSIAGFWASFASHNFTGHFREPLLDTFFAEYANRHFSIFSLYNNSHNNDSIIHIVTRTYETGGHSRFIENVVKLDKSRKHHLLVLDQQQVTPRKTLEELIWRQDGKVHRIQSGDFIERGKELLEFVTRYAGIIMLHQHPDDLLPSLTLPVLNESYRILFFNHADHCFSLGLETADEVINIRQEAHNITVYERNQPYSHILHLPILKNESDTLDKVLIRNKWGIQADQKLGLCIGNPQKFIPGVNHHFFKTLHAALDRNPQLVVFIIGVTTEHAQHFQLGYEAHERLQLLGPIADPSELQQISDLVIDPMPMGSYTALLETAFYGALPLVCYGTIPLFNLYDDPALSGLFTIAKNEAEYLDQLESLLKKSDQGLKDIMQQQIEREHGAEKWLSVWNEIIDKISPVPVARKPEHFELLILLDQSEKEKRFGLLNWLYNKGRSLRPRTFNHMILQLLLQNFSRKEVFGILKKRYLSTNEH